MNVHKSYRDESRKDYGKILLESENLTLEQLQTGALLRIADAAEKLAASYDTLWNERDFQEGRAKHAHERLAKAQRSNRALRGYLKRLKRKAAP
jgi:hypothetical protein